MMNYVQLTKLLVQFKMRILLIIAVFCLAGVRFSNAREDQIEEMRKELTSCFTPAAGLEGESPGIEITSGLMVTKI